jgi:hypothetical protein
VGGERPSELTLSYPNEGRVSNVAHKNAIFFRGRALFDELIGVELLK